MVKDERAEHDRTWLAQLIIQAQKQRYYGKLTITMEQGRIRRVVKEESLKPPMQPETNLE